MGRYLGAKCRLCRRAGMKLFIKGPRCVMEKCSFSKRPVPPGMQSMRRGGKPTYYALQLKEKQKVKRMYGLLEKQFKRFFAIANKSKGVTGRFLIQLLERRLDNVIFRAIFAASRNQARQVVRHGFVFIDGRRVNVPSYIVGDGQVIELRVKDALAKNIKENIEASSKERSIPSWMEVDNSNLKITVKRLPEKEDLIIPVDEQLIVELYSK